MYWEDNFIKIYHETHDYIFILQTLQLLTSGTFFLTRSVVQCTARHPVGRLEDPGRPPTGHLPGAIGTPAHRTEPVRLPVGTRPAPCQHPAGTLTGALHFTRPIFSGHLPGAAEYVTTHAVEMKIGRFPYGL